MSLAPDHGPVPGEGFGPYTVRDLDALPEGGKGFELEDGWLIELSPSPWHNWAGQKLARILDVAAEHAGASVFVGFGGEWDVSTPAGIRKPDVFLIDREVARAAIEDRSPQQIPGRELLLAVEVISPGSASERTDRVRKVKEYAGLGVPQYWIVDLDPHPHVVVLGLEEGSHSYRALHKTDAGSVLEVEVPADKPLTVSFDPAMLTVLD